MDILRFVNSKAIREHLENINYQFNTLEAAYLIYFCRSLTLEKRHRAWREAIETMPDMAPKDHFDHFCWEYFGDSIHACLKQHIKNEQILLDDFTKVKKGAFYVRIFDKSDKELNASFNSDRLMTDIDDIYDYIHNYIKDDEGELCKYKVYCKPNNSQKRLCVTINRNDEIIDVEIDSEHYPQPRLDWQLETMWFAFPTPFKRGDIVIDPQRPEPSKLWSGPFVFDETAAEWLTSRNKKGHDYTDMTANGWFQDKDGVIYGECMHDYMSIEYYPPEKLKGVQRILIALSNHIKNEIGDELFINAYHSMLMGEYAKKIRPRYYTDEGLKLAGLKE